MKVKRFFARNMQAGLKLIAEEMGDDAVILSNKRVEGGLEIVAGMEEAALSQDKVNQMAQPEPVTKSVATPAVNTQMTQAQWQENGVIKANNENALNKASLNDLLSDLKSGGPFSHHVKEVPENKKSKLEQMLDSEMAFSQSAKSLQSKIEANQIESALQSRWPETASQNESGSNIADPEIKKETATNLQAHQESRTPPQAQETMVQQSIFDAPVAQQKSAPVAKVEMAEMKAEIHSLKTLLQQQNDYLMQQEPLPKFVGKMDGQLEQLGFTSSIRQKVLHNLPTEKNEANTQLWARLSQETQIANVEPISQGGIYALVGPTGTGKTTSIAKLAAKFVMAHGASRVALVSMDQYQIGAQDTLKLISKILGVKYASPKEGQSLNDVLANLSDKALVLIDTSGCQKGVERLTQELNRGGSFVGQIQSILTLPATAQYQCLQGFCAQLKNIKPSYSIITKLDETNCLGAVLSTLINLQLPIAYWTDGQSIPEDIHVAKAHQLLARMSRKTNINTSAMAQVG